MLLDGSSGLLDRCREQFAYGHVDILQRYSQREPNHFLVGRLPHDEWGKPAAGSPRGKFRSPSGRELPVWTWNRDWEQWHRSAGSRRAVAIGAPWLYLLRVHGVVPIWESELPPEPRESSVQRALYVPLHSWERDVLDLGQSAQDVAGMLDPERTTVLLGWADFLSRRTREAFESQGFRVTCNGYRGGAVAPESPAGDRAVFLENMLELLQSVDIVVSEEMCTALVYAAAMGKQIHVGKELQSAMRAGVSDVWSNYRSGASFITDLDNQALEYDWASDAGADVYLHRDQIRIALGGDCMRSPAELDSLLVWREMP